MAEIAYRIVAETEGHVRILVDLRGGNLNGYAAKKTGRKCSQGGGGPSPLRPKWAYIFFIVSSAWACDETNFKLLLRRKKI